MASIQQTQFLLSLSSSKSPLPVCMPDHMPTVAGAALALAPLCSQAFCLSAGADKPTVWTHHQPEHTHTRAGQIGGQQWGQAIRFVDRMAPGRLFCGLLVGGPN